MNKQKTRGTLYVIAAPSGGGKTSLVRRLLEMDTQIKRSISHTTRQKRPNEIDGQHYFFVSNKDFSDMLEKKAFLEHAIVFGHFYGTSSQRVFDLLQEGTDVILEIDWQGARQVKKLFANFVSIFILPPCYKTLEERLALRGQDSEEVIRRRMQQSHDEIAHCKEFDFVVFNDEFETCLQQIHSIILSQRLRYSQQFWRNEERLRQLTF